MLTFYLTNTKVERFVKASTRNHPAVGKANRNPFLRVLRTLEGEKDSFRDSYVCKANVAAPNPGKEHDTL